MLKKKGWQIQTFFFHFLFVIPVSPDGRLLFRINFWSFEIGTQILQYWENLVWLWKMIPAVSDSILHQCVEWQQQLPWNAVKKLFDSKEAGGWKLYSLFSLYTKVRHEETYNFAQNERSREMAPENIFCDTWGVRAPATLCKHRKAKQKSACIQIFFQSHFFLLKGTNSIFVCAKNGGCFESPMASERRDHVEFLL